VLDDGLRPRLADGGGTDGGPGAYFANVGKDIHVVGSLAPIIPASGLPCDPDGSHQLAHVEPDRVAQPPN
jgi:hypothetical protein